jgi:hypothetical protein
MFLEIGFDDVMVNAIKDLRSTSGGGVLSAEFSGFQTVFSLIAASGVLFFLVKRYFEDQSTGRQFEISRYTKPFMILIMIMLYKPIMNVIDGFFNTMTEATYRANGRFLIGGVDLTNATIGGLNIQSTVSGLVNGIFPGFSSNGGSASNGQQFKRDIKGTPEEINKMNELIAVTEDGYKTDDKIVNANNEISLGGDQKDVAQGKETGLATNMIKTLGETINPLTKITAYVLLILLYACGPIALGLSVWPGFESTLTNFIGTYIKISMWPALANLVAFLVFKIITAPGVVATLAANNLFNSGRETTLTTTFFASVFILNTLVPKIANGIVGIGQYYNADKVAKESGNKGNNTGSGE